MDELMSIGRIELAESTPPECIGPSQLKDLAYTARAAHEYKAEVERLKKEVERLVLMEGAASNTCVDLDAEVLSLEQENARLKEQFAAHTRPATDWRSE